MTVSVTEKQRRSFDSLVEDGVYSDDFDHPPKSKAFVADVLSGVITAAKHRVRSDRPLTLLDCGCGTGAWLSFLAQTLQREGIDDIRCCGFDLSGKMVEVARRKLAGLADPRDLRSGNVLEVPSYEFTGLDQGFDLLFSYDVIQQLPKDRQYQACEVMVSKLAPGGVALIFDNDCQSKFGRRMAWRKFLTRYCGLRLVPRYYCNAAYPPLEQIRRRLNSGSADAQVYVRADRVKRALVMRAASEGSAHGDVTAVS